MVFNVRAQQQTLTSILIALLENYIYTLFVYVFVSFSVAFLFFFAHFKWCFKTGLMQRNVIMPSGQMRESLNETKVQN